MTKRTTANDVAQAAGVSRATVSFVLNRTPGQTISAGVKEKVIEEAERLGYQPHPHARALASGQSKIVLIILPKWPVEFLLRGMLDQASSDLDAAGYSLVTLDPRLSNHAIPLWITLRPDVVIAVDEIPESARVSISAAGIPLILPDASELESFDRGSQLQFEHLVSRGHKVIAFASTTVRGMEKLNQARLNRVRALAQAAGLGVVDGVVDADNSREVVSNWRQRGVTGVAAFNDDVAALVLGAAIRNGVKVPSELAIVGHDDSPMASMLVPSLTTVRFDVPELGHGFAQQALSLLGATPLAPLTPEAMQATLIKRESS